jgi:hypothetical protein
MQRSAGNPRKCRSRRVGHAAAPLEIDERYRYSQSSLIILLLLFRKDIAHYITYDYITHSTSTYISTVQADDEICADHQVLNGHHNREYIHKLLTRISSSVYLFSLYMHISSILRWDTTRVVLGCCCYSFICNTAGCKCITGRGVGIALFVCLKAIVLVGSFGSWCTLYIYV